jgi:hypothetical protein
MALIVVGHGAEPPLLHRQARPGAIEGLDRLPPNSVEPGNRLEYTTAPAQIWDWTRMRPYPIQCSLGFQAEG